MNPLGNQPIKTETIRKTLETHGLKVTPQRSVVLGYLMSTDRHPNAEEVFQAVSIHLAGAISKATVYNTLNTLVDAGAIVEVSAEPGVTRYDANIESHHHFIDRETGRIYDIPWESVEPLCQTLGNDFSIQDYHVTFYGKALKQDHSPP